MKSVIRTTEYIGVDTCQVKIITEAEFGLLVEAFKASFITNIAQPPSISSHVGAAGRRM